MVGTENNVRVDAEIYGEDMVQGASLSIKYDLTNQRSSPILVADLLPETTYDPDTRMVTVIIGSEIPGEEFLPRLISIPLVNGGHSMPCPHQHPHAAERTLVAEAEGVAASVNFSGTRRRS